MTSSKACRLLGGPPAWIAQGVLAILAISALLYKRQREKPRRAIATWSFDVSKQVLSMLVAHACGLVIAAAVSKAAQRLASECAWYFVAFIFDTTLGVALTIGLHFLVLRVAKWKMDTSSFAQRIHDCGNYGNPPEWTRFWPQVLEWISVTMLARLVCGSMVILFRSLLIHLASLLDAIFRGHPVALLFFVMICCPLLMNIFQAVIQDIVLRWRGLHSSPLASDAEDSEGAQELSNGPLLTPTEKRPDDHFQKIQVKHMLDEH